MFNPHRESYALSRFIRVMKLTNLIVLFTFMSVTASVYSQVTKLDLKVQDRTIKEILSQIEDESDFFFMYNDRKIDVSRKMNLDIKQAKIEDILKKIFEGTDAKFIVKNRQIVIYNETSEEINASNSEETTQQQKSVSGKVTDSSGSPLPGVSVVVKGTTIGVITDMGGKYYFAKVPENATLQFSFVGMKTQEVKIGTKTSIDVVLADETVGIEEVVAVAYGTSTKAAFTGSASTVKAELLSKSSSSNVATALQGQSAGVQVVSNSGKPGATSDIKIRGIGSMNADNNPLIIIDGAPFIGSINSVPMSDIESVTVLKDAASTSLYGSRAANGVIMITTKTAKGNSPVISFRSTWGTSDFAVPLPEKVSSDRQYELVWEGIYYDELRAGKTDAIARTTASKNTPGKFFSKKPITLSDGTKREYRNNYNMDYPVGEDGKIKPEAQLLYKSDWYEQVYKRKLRQEYNLDVSGGQEKLRYFISSTYLDDKGQYLSQGYNRWTIRTNLSSQIKDWIKVESSLFYSRDCQEDPDENTRVLRTIGNVSIPYEWNHDKGTYFIDMLGRPSLDWGGTDSESGRVFFPGYNPLQYKYDAKSENPYAFNIYKTNLLTFRNSIIIDIAKGLQYKTNISGSYSINNAHNYQSPLFGLLMTKGSANKTFTERFNFTYNNLITYTKNLNDHTFSLLTGQELYSFKGENVNGSIQNFPLPGLFELSGGSENPQVASYEDNYRLVSFLSKLDYDYKNKIYFSAGYRIDGSSRFHPNTRWGNFWSFSGSWRLSEENFIKKINWINNLKLKASYGTTGNDRIGYYAYQGLFSLGNSYFSQAGALEKRLPTENLKWEKNIQSNIGLEFSFLNRISISFEAFKRESSDLLFARPLPPSFGISSIDDNIADIENIGFETNADIAVFKGEFKWNVGINATHYKNKITSLPVGKMYDPYSSIRKWTTGGSIYDYYTPDWAGINPETGYSQWWKYTFDGQGNIIDKVKTANWNDVNTDAQRMFQGSSLPKLFGSISTVFSWKGFDLSAMLYYSIGGIMRDGLYTESVTMRNAFALTTMYEEGKWYPGRTDAKFMRPSHVYFTDGSRSSDQFIFDNTFARIRNVSIGYTFPKKISQKIGVSNLKVFGVGENIFTLGSAAKRFTDPESSGFDGNTVAQNGVRMTLTGGIQIQF